MDDHGGFVAVDGRAYDDYVHPRSTAEVRDVVLNARASGAQVRVRGAMHSERGSVLGDGFSLDGRRRVVIDVMLDRMTDIRDGASPGVVLVGAGVSMGGDPHAPGLDNPEADPELSLFRYLRNRGRALPITGGISHQTISGFLLTGSAGGSLTRSLHDVVVALTLVDGNGDIRRIHRGDADFPAVLVSLGLYGVVCEVELETRPAYGIRGHRSVQRAGDCDVDLFNDPPTAGRWSLREYFEKKPVSRLLWWPQPGIDRVELWDTACDAPVPTDSERIPQALGVIGPVPQLLARGLYAVGFEGLAPGAGEGRHPSDLEKLVTLLMTPLRFARLSAQFVYDLLSPSSPTRIDRADARAILDALVAVTRGARPFEGGPLDPRGVPTQQSVRDALRELVAGLHGLHAPERIIALALSLFVPLSQRAEHDWVDDDGLVRRYTAQRFLDTWEDGLPMDNPVHDRLLPVQFTELWLPIDRAAAAMTALATHFRDGRLGATGTFTVEVYAAKRSPAFMSAAYEQDVLRIDPFRYDDGDEEGSARFFEQFYEVLRPFEPRFHWAKALSEPSSTTGVAYRRALCPRWDDFLALRQDFDPDDLFLTRYWAEHLGIAPSSPDPLHADADASALVDI